MIVPLKMHFDPLAVGLANASSLGIGYLMLGRWMLALNTTLITGLLVGLHVTVLPTVWFEIVILLWWLALVVHGWRVAGRRARRGAVGWQRLVALGVTIPVVLGMVILRVDAASINQGVTDARESGNCTRADQELSRIWFGDRVADAPLIEAQRATGQACQALRTAAQHLHSSDGAGSETGANPAELKAGFDGMNTVLTRYPGHEAMVEKALNSFVSKLNESPNACFRAATTDWLRQRKPSGNLLDRTFSLAARIAPTALVDCADGQSQGQQWDSAKARYQQFLAQFPTRTDLVPRARRGLQRAILGSELKNVTDLLGASGGIMSAYCDTPARYSAAPAYRKGTTNRALFYGGEEEYTSKFPAGWNAPTVAQTSLVVCMGSKDYGTLVRSCPYTSSGAFGSATTEVKFHRIAIPVKAYELRTGNLVYNKTTEIGGTSCPSVISYNRSGIADYGPPDTQYVNPSSGDIQDAFRPLINRQ